MVIHLATDHAGFEYKQAISAWLQAEGFAVVDHGASTLDNQDDFPDYISLAATAVSNDSENCRAIIFGGSGQGEAMVANRYPNVRATVFYGGDQSIPALSRQHNNSNVLSIGARFVEIDIVKQVIWEWLHIDFADDEKYQRRNDKIESLTKKIT